MKILSFDIGIKNLAYCCFFITSENNIQIESWDIINLCEEKNYTCQGTLNTKKAKGKICGKQAKYQKNGLYYCKQHAKKTEFKIPTSTSGISFLKKLKKMKIAELFIQADKHALNYKKPIKKDDLILLFEKHYKEDYMEPIEKIRADDMSLPSISRNMTKAFNNLFKDDEFDHVIIENQVSPLANRMKTIQGMVTQYFVMKNVPNIEYISSSNKLKNFIEKKKTTYSERKQLGIEVTLKQLHDKAVLTPWIDFFKTHKKKDDLADSFLQGLWFLEKDK
tara:strand:- start:434 stop:1267 length:834 start_codon:yes stop_codon:yes gene_type:complete